ncbi:allophanate hydrolase [Conexibacter sp. DBS9H8]|uniref:allophanate hydrolase n=1 Tax=Conexibacter sp. DBS9H8 TaxID=2937801 RepID=UPI0020101ECF|nr:allophanate hydrolase [Conexibacter sp. DBS9H8]
MTVWIHRRPESEVAAEVAAARRAGDGPLSGLRVAVKDNIDVAGIATTCACPAYAYVPDRDADVVARLRAAGAVIVGKTNMDQFATGLVGTRSPYGPVLDARRPAYVSGGSSSGSAVAVAAGEVDLALGTDTAGSGRVPAAFAGIVGAKPAPGRLSSAGVVPACRSFDCVSVFARSVALAELAVAVMAGQGHPVASAPADGPPRLAVFAPAGLEALSAGYRAAFDRTCAALAEAGAALTEVDAEPFLAAGRLLYEGAFIAERYAAVGDFIAAHTEACDPTVTAIILAGASVSGADYVADRAALDELVRVAREALAGCEALLVPTVPFQPTLAAVTAEPVAVNRRLGAFTTFANLLGLAAYAIPAGTADGGCFGVSLLAPGETDGSLSGIAQWALAHLPGGSEAAGPAAIGTVAPRHADTLSEGPDTVALLVVGAHLSGMALNHQLTDRGARLLGEVSTAAAYRFYALDTDPPKPGLVRVGAAGGGAAIRGELWAIDPGGLGSLLAALPPPMALGPVRLADGRLVTGFLCEPAGLEGAEDITDFGGWRDYRLSPSRADPRDGAGAPTSPARE